MNTDGSPRQDSLLIFQMILLAEVVLYRVILKLLLKFTATWHDVGSNFLGFWLLAVVPGALVLAGATSLGYRWFQKRRPRLAGAWLAGAYFVDAVLLLTSLVVYSRYFHA